MELTRAPQFPPTLLWNTRLLYGILTAKGWSKIQGNAFPLMVFGDLLRFLLPAPEKRIMKVFKFYFSFSYRARADSWVCAETLAEKSMSNRMEADIIKLRSKIFWPWSYTRSQSVTGVHGEVGAEMSLFLPAPLPEIWEFFQPRSTPGPAPNSSLLLVRSSS